MEGQWNANDRELA